MASSQKLKSIKYMQCDFIKPNGEKCKANAVTKKYKDGKFYCFSHNPAVAGERQKARAKGGLASMGSRAKLSIVNVRTPKEIANFTADLINEIRTNKIDKKRASVISSLLGQMVKVLELEELADRISELEQSLKGRRLKQ